MPRIPDKLVYEFGKRLICPIIGSIAAGIAALYKYIIYDAYDTAKENNKILKINDYKEKRETLNIVWDFIVANINMLITIVSSSIGLFLVSISYIKLYRYL